jgi:glycosyltransferase involved in cell wall biosynthesis
MIKVSIIITARNYANYLDDTIRSCINQTVKPFQIIYCDDYSSDNSVQVAMKYENITLLPFPKHLGVVKARNWGAKKAKGNVLIFVDGDDMLPPDYIEKHLEVFSKRTPFVYGAAQAFGNKNNFWRVRPYNECFIWHRNFVNTSAMMWKKAFFEAGAWMDTPDNTMWDWHLALRLCRLGTPAKSSAVLLYRQHDNNWSATKGKIRERLPMLSASLRRNVVNVSIGLIYSGRIPDFINNWIGQLIIDIKCLTHKPQLIIVNNSPDDLKRIEFQYMKFFSEIKIVTGHAIVFDNEVDRRNKVAEMLSEQYNRIIELSSGELIHLREDDIIPNKGSFELLFNQITQGVKLVNAVAGVYLNRKIDRIVGGFYNESPEMLSSHIDQQPFAVDFTGTGFLLFWKSICPIFEPYVNKIQAHDWAWGLKLKNQGGKLIMIPQAVAKHYIDNDNYVEYSPDIIIDKITTFSQPSSPEKRIVTTDKQKCIIRKSK